MTGLTCILIGIAVLLAGLVFQVWRLSRNVEEQNNEWLDYVKALGELIDDLRKKMDGSER
ncbi:MAG: hypothetical protein R3200_14405 [Xanthomonadales bacterium]|nr:hypothetical protein [Xanthomonadales bacterium]